MKRSIVLSVPLENDGDAPRIFEVLSRAAAGLLLDGVEASIYTYRDDEEGEG